MAIADKLLAINQVKQDIKVAIENKNIDLTGVDFGGYAGKIDEIETGGGTSGVDILYHGPGLDSGYAVNKYDGKLLSLNLNKIIQDFPSISEFIAEDRVLFIVNDGTNTTTGQGFYYTKPDGSSMGIISNTYIIILSNGLIFLKFDAGFAPHAVVELTQAQYDALSVYDNNTYYLIVGE